MIALGKRYEGSSEFRKSAFPFMAAKDNPQVKHGVLQLISGQELRIDATIIDKQTVRPELRRRHRLYAAIWASHLVHVLSNLSPRPSQADVTVASIGTAADARAFRRGAE